MPELARVAQHQAGIRHGEWGAEAAEHAEEWNRAGAGAIRKILNTRYRYRTVWVLIVLAGCSEPTIESAETLRLLNARVDARADSILSTGDSCTRIHHVWRDQLRIALTFADSSQAAREAAFVDSVYRPHDQFWQGYVGGKGGFMENVASRWVDLERDPRAALPVHTDVGGMIMKATRLTAALAGRPPRCADWYLLYGPGYANLGGLGTGEMLVDFFGISNGLRELQIYLPHEVAHVLYGGRPDDPRSGTLLSSMLGEGFATYFTVVFHDGTVSPAEALGYSPEEWDWAVAHERALWKIAEAALWSRDEELIQRFRAAGEHVRPGAPGKIGYFIGLRILDSYVQRHGEDSWVDFFELPVGEILSKSGYLETGYGAESGVMKTR